MKKILLSWALMFAAGSPSTAFAEENLLEVFSVLSSKILIPRHTYVNGDVLGDGVNPDRTVAPCVIAALPGDSAHETELKRGSVLVVRQIRPGVLLFTGIGSEGSLKKLQVNCIPSQDGRYQNTKDILTTLGIDVVVSKPSAVTASIQRSSTLRQEKTSEWDSFLAYVKLHERDHVEGIFDARSVEDRQKDECSLFDGKAPLSIGYEELERCFGRLSAMKRRISDSVAALYELQAGNVRPVDYNLRKAHLKFVVSAYALAIRNLKQLNKKSKRTSDGVLFSDLPNFLQGLAARFGVFPIAGVTLQDYIVHFESGLLTGKLANFKDLLE